MFKKICYIDPCVKLKRRFITVMELLDWVCSVCKWASGLCSTTKLLGGGIPT